MINRPEYIFLQRCLSSHKIFAKDVQQEMQIKAPVIHYLMPSRIATVKQPNPEQRWAMMWGNWNFFTLLGRL